MTDTVETHFTEADEMIRYVALREICTELSPAGSPLNSRIIGAANRAAVCLASDLTHAEMLADMDERIPGLSEEETAIAIKVAAQFVETKAAA